MKPRIFEIRKSKIPDETEDFCAFPSFLPRHTLSHSSAPSPATAAEPCWTFSLSQKTQGSLFSWAWRELSCKWEQRENLFSLCRAQPKVSKTHFYEGFDFQILQPILLWLSERNKGRLKDWRILQTMVFGICAREALLFVRVHLLTAPINEEMKNLLYSCYKKLKETFCAS